jgi:hypothetical protein
MTTPRICRAHDADDPVPDSICGHTLPCPDHPRGCNVVRLRPAKQARIRQGVLFTLSDEARERLRSLTKSRGKSASRIVEELILATKRS